MSDASQAITPTVSFTSMAAGTREDYELLELLVRETDRPVLQSNARREVRADVGELGFGAVQNRGQVPTTEA